MDNFEEALQVELDKLPYEQHVDDGMYNDGKQAGFELGARWALEYIKSILPTEVSNHICSCNTLNYGYGYAKCFDCGKLKIINNEAGHTL